MTINSDPVAVAETPAPGAATVLAPQVVEEEQIVMQAGTVDLASAGLEGMVEGQVIMMTNAQGEQEHVVITSSGITPLTHGAQVIQVQAGPGPTLTDAGYLLDPSSMKSEPEDLSFSVTPGPRGEAEAGDMRRSIDLEAGTQASEATVQNVLWSLKESDKTIINQILPSHMMGVMSPATPTQSLVQSLSSDMMMDPEAARPDSGLRDTTGTPARSRNRTAAESSPRVHTAKQYSQFGFHNTLEAATAQRVRKDENRSSANSDHDYVRMKYSEGKVQIKNIKYQVLLLTCFSSS